MTHVTNISLLLGILVKAIATVVYVPVDGGHNEQALLSKLR